MNGLEKAIKKAGTASNLATLLGIKPMSVSRWKNRYKGIVPHDRVFSLGSTTFTFTWHGTTYTVSLVADYVNMSGLLAAISEGLTGSGLVAQDNGGTVLITEESSPFAGGSITSSSLPSSVFGDTPAYSTGTASTGGSAAITANVTLAYSSATGTAFSGILCWRDSPGCDCRDRRETCGTVRSAGECRSHTCL